MNDSDSGTNFLLESRNRSITIGNVTQRQSSSTFWTSTGTFPQEFIITLADVTSVQSIRIECYNVRKLAVEHSISSEPINFEPLSEIELEHNESNLQTEDINVKIVQAQHLRFIIRSAYDHFTSVHRVSVAGNIQHR
ncbi:intraflagellar transport protein 25 homolog isoform X2 [Petromyzon marinus]|uniref:Intraflagellar transport protein 25 homolog isoform X2 n=1 Tax=Petromyzon marinus TaxID=7757 RepID=A0AAJ7TRV3_PETMA|nr:intraflagellar transport protein 25 homolog isoform X2 [Petromyzon marinus]